MGFTMHALSGRSAIREAVKNKGKCKVIGVTILTSADASRDQIIQFAKILAQERVGGIVCSAQEANLIRKFTELKV